MKRYELSPEQWRRIEAIIPGKEGDRGRSGKNNLQFVNGVLWVLRSGAHWHDLPERYGKWKTAHKRVSRDGPRPGYGKRFSMLSSKRRIMNIS